MMDLSDIVTTPVRDGKPQFIRGKIEPAHVIVVNTPDGHAVKATDSNGRTFYGVPTGGFAKLVEIGT